MAVVSLSCCTNNAKGSATLNAQQLAAKKLYALLDEDPTQIPAGSDLETFYNQVQTTGIPEFKAVETAIAEDLDPTSNSDKAVLAGYYDLLDGYTTSLMSIDSVLAVLKADTLQDNTAQISIALTQRGIVQQNYDTVAAQLEVLAKGIDSVITASADAIKAANAFLPDTEVWEYNQKQVQDIYLNTVAKSEMHLDETQKMTLQGIAAQCPLSGGDAVYAARSLYASIENVVYDDPQICWEQGISMRPNAPHTPKATENSKQKENTIRLYPNPAYNYCMIEVLQQGNVQVRVFDILGKEVYRTTLTTLGKILLSTSDYITGIYTVKIIIDDEIKSVQKLIIAK